MNSSGTDASESVVDRSLAHPRWAQLQRYGLAIFSVGAALGVSLLLQHLQCRDAGVPLLLFAVAISSWYGGPGPAAIAVLLSMISFYWYFVEPARAIYIYPSEVPYFIIFAAFAALISWFATIRRRTEALLREQANLLNLTHDTIFVMNMEGVIKYWNRGAEERYGWTGEQAVGRDVHDLLKTVFPTPLEQIKGELTRTGRWEGELVHTKKDGPQVVVASRWALQRDERGTPVAILETNNDITERKRAEDALRRSEGYLAEAQRLSRTGSWASDGATREPLYWSEEMFRIHGFDPQKGIPTRNQVFHRIHPEDRAKVKEYSDRTFREKVDYDVEYRFVLPDGTVKHLHGLGHPVLSSKGDIVEVVGTNVDITEHKRAEDALRRSEDYLAEAQRLSHTGSRAWDLRTGDTVYCSEELYRIFAMDPQEGMPSTARLLERIHPDDRDKVRVVNTEAASELEYRLLMPDGKVKYIHSVRQPLGDATGTVTEMIGTAIDVTERKRAEEALRESETRFRTFVDHAADAFFILDIEQGSIVDVNRTACESLGYTRQELIGRTPLAFDMNLDRATLDSVAERTAAGKTVLFDRHWYRRKDGSLFPVEVQTTIFSHGGRRFLLKVARDISDRVRAEEQREKLRQLEADLAHINRVGMMGELTASIAHEVNQPLSGVVSNGSACLRWLAGDAPNVEEAREAARRIVRDGKRAGEVIARVRALAKRAATPNEKLDLNETIREVLALVGDEAKRKGVMIRAQFTDDLSPISGDRVQLQQVVLNLAMNAIEAMSSVEERPRELLITTRNLDAEQVQVTVKDSGPGIDPNTIDKIFDPFYTTKSGGMGMGLSISRSILQAHGGRLWAAAKDGPGTIFHFSLPKYQEEGANAGAAAV